MEAPAGTRVFRRRTGPLWKVLVISKGAPIGVVKAAFAGARTPSWRTIRYFHELEGERSAQEISVLGLSLAPDSHRLLNLASYAVNLSESEDSLLRAMGAKSRNMLRKAEASGLSIRESGAEGLTAFRGLYESIAGRAGVDQPEPEFLRRVFEGGELLILSAKAGDETQGVVLIYLMDRHGYYLHGATHAQAPNGTGQLLQWAAIRALKARGLKWYDLGGVKPLRDGGEPDGIHRFKESLGGQYVGLGAEYLRIPPAIAGVYALYRNLRRAF